MASAKMVTDRVHISKSSRSLTQTVVNDKWRKNGDLSPALPIGLDVVQSASRWLQPAIRQPFAAANICYGGSPQRLYCVCYRPFVRSQASEGQHGDLTSRSGFSTMRFPGIADPEQITLLREAFDTYCAAHNIQSKEDRDDAAHVIMSLYSSGISTLEDLSKSLFVDLNRHDRRPDRSEAEQ